MGLKPNCYLEFAVIVVCIIWQLPIFVQSAPTVENKSPSCTECCSFIACMKFDHNFFVQASKETNFMDQLCRNLDNATALCFSPAILSDCVYVKRIIEAFPNQANQIGENLKAACEKKKYFAEVQNISLCIIASGFGGDVLNRCTKQYMESLKDPKADVCETIKTLNTCVVVVMTVTKCVDTNSELYREVIKSQHNPLCDKTSDIST